MKTAKVYLEAADAVVAKIDVSTAFDIQQTGKAIFIDVRDSSATTPTDTSAGALRILRDVIEFFADPEMPVLNPTLQKDAEIYLVCGLGGRAAVAGQTLLEMGFENVTNVGGIIAWRGAGGPMEDV